MTIELNGPCWTCGRAGWVFGIDADPLPSGEPGEPYQTQETCPDCGGSGIDPQTIETPPLSEDYR